MFAAVKGAVRLCLFMLWCGLMIPPQMIVMAFTKGPGSRVLPRFFHIVVCRIFNIQVEVKGAPATNAQVLFAGNHVSYFDIMVIATQIPESFIAKKEVASWPLFGFLSRLQQTAFIDRNPRRARDGNALLDRHLKEGHSLILFAEGTSSSGKEVLPFKSSLFQVIMMHRPSDRALMVQPFTIELVETDGRRVETDADRDLYAWYGDMTLLPHLWAFAGSRGARVRLHFHAPFDAAGYDDRKKLAGDCEAAVRAPLAGGTETGLANAA